ncbi:MAG: hypothetical protein FWG30_08375 [Eubacteriaceae bacterium]|nr:hypothetical protein [Eubacteriaceae bacterium]
MDFISETLALRVIHSAPVYSLEECILSEQNSSGTRYTNDLHSLSDIAAKILEDFIFKASAYTSKALNKILDDLSALNERKMPAPEAAFLPYLIETLYIDRFIYFYKQNDDIHIVLPNELRLIYKNIKEEKGISEKALRTREMRSYAAALHNLYGVYKIGQYVEIWNRHHKEKMSIMDAESFYYDYDGYNSIYYAEGGYIISEWIGDDEVDYLIERAESSEIDYYMPTKSVISAYADEDWEYEKTEYSAQIQVFLKGIFSSNDLLDELFMDLTNPFSAGIPGFIYNCLQESGFPLENKELCLEFEKLYDNLFSNMRLWRYFGHTQCQISLLYGQENPPFRLNNEN